MKYLFRALAAFAMVFAGANAASAQGWPNRPIRMIVPYTAGGYTDLMARLVGQKISEALGQPVVFENKPGANAIIGTDAVAKAAPDGYTIGTVIAAHAVNATLNPKLPYDTHEGLQLRLADERGAADPDRASLAAGEQHAGTDRARQGEARRTQFRLQRRRRRGASDHGDVQEPHRHRHAAHSLQGHRRRAAGHRRRAAST